MITRLSPVVHEAWCSLRLIGLRDRLRCPRCGSVGTWKPHGGWWDRRNGDRPVRRWLCKWCGHYVGPEGTLRAFPDLARGWWTLPRPWDPEAPAEPGRTPADVLRDELAGVWPGRG